MITYSIWDKKRDLYPPAGGKQTPENIFETYGWAENPSIRVLIGEDHGVWVSIYNFETMKENFKIETEDVEEAVKQIADIFNAPPPEPSVHEAGGAYDEFIEGMLEGMGL